MISLTLASTLLQPDFQAWGEGVIEGIRRELYLPAQKLYAEDSSRKQVSFNWPSGVMLSALNGAARANPKYKPWLREYADQMRARYWHQEGGFDVLPLPKARDCYYDDNSWMGLAYVETWQVLGDAKYLKWAEETATYVLSGEDARLGGGIYWREDRRSKNTCSNGNSALLLVRLYRATKKQRYLADAQRILGWTNRRLRVPGSGLYWDNLSLSGKVDKQLYSYNTALPLAAALEIADVTGNEGLRVMARESMDSALAHWLDPKTRLLKDDMAFAHLLYESFARRGDRRLDAAVVALHEVSADSKGHYGHRWDSVPTGDRAVWRLIDQASAARAFFVASR